jgi:hypothetical protein
MTHAECQDLLLDLAYGELDAARSAEAELHVAGCAHCRRERAQMAATRKVAAPLREMEEPSASFDARILAAARAEASLQSDGKPGPVIEVTGNVRPLGLEPARIDAHAKVSAAPDRRRRRWVMRVALGGSAAAAAALALVVSPSLWKPAERRDDAERYAIRVQTAAERAQTEALQEARKAARLDEAAARLDEAQKPKAETQRPRAEAPSALVAPLAKERKAAPKMAHLSRETDAVDDTEVGGAVADKTAAKGAGGDAPGRVERHDLTEPAAPNAVAPPAASPMSGVASGQTTAVPGKDAQRLRAFAIARQAPTPQTPEDKAAVEELTPQQYEQKAQEARRSGNYVLAASLYRRAAALRRNDDSTAAWDLAHAVECLAAAGYGAEALEVRDQLKASHASETSAFNAAQRSLIHLEVPAAAEKPTKAKSEPSAAPAKTDEKSDSKVPSD